MDIADKDGKTAAHYAAAARDGDKCFDMLIQAGADPARLDSVPLYTHIYSVDII